MFFLAALSAWHAGFLGLLDRYTASNGNFCVCLRRLGAGLAAAAAVAAALPPVAGQIRSAAGPKAVYVAPRTAWGDPDLQGLWTSDDMRGVPRERPDEFGARPFLTDEEYLKRIEQDEQTERRQLRGPYGARNDLRTRTFRATSLVVDPPDGRIPALTTEAAVARSRELRRRPL